MKIRTECDTQKKGERGKPEGVSMNISAAVQDLLNQRIEWPPAHRMECGAFQDAVMPKIKRRLFKARIRCGEDQAAEIAARIWRELRE